MVTKTLKNLLYRFHLIIILFFINNLVNCSYLINLGLQKETQVFEVFFDDFRTIYAYASEYTNNDIDCSIDKLYQKYKPQVSDGMGEARLASIFLQIEFDCNDPHLVFFFPTATRNAAYSELDDDFLEEILNRNPLDNITSDFYEYVDFSIEKKKINFHYGLIARDKTIGYIRIVDLVNSLGGAGRLKGNQNWLKGIEEIIKELKKQNVESMIIDIRTEAGGSLDNARYIAARFVNNAGAFMKYYEKTSPTSFKRVDVHIEPQGKHRFSEGKIILLTSKQTCSGGENFTLAMRKRTNLIQVGYEKNESNRTSTLGCPGFIVERDLPTGWLVRFTSSQSYCIDNDPCASTDSKGRKDNYFRRGIQADFNIESPNWQANNLSSLALENAIYLLQNENIFQQVYNTLERHK